MQNMASNMNLLACSLDLFPREEGWVPGQVSRLRSRGLEATRTNCWVPPGSSALLTRGTGEFSHAVWLVASLASGRHLSPKP